MIIDNAGGVYLFREGSLVDRAALNISGCDSVGVAVNGRWVGVSSREDHNIVLWELELE